MKKVFVIAGFDTAETAASPKCRELRNAFSAKGYEVVPVDISWKHRLPSQFAKEFATFYRKYKGEDNTVIGNSFGAVAALLSVTETRPDRLILCSLSPFFQEDLKISGWPTEKHKKLLGKRRLEDIGRFSARELADQLNKLKIKTTVMYGAKEHQTSPNLVARAKEFASRVKDCDLVEVPHAPHSFIDPVYTGGIAEVL